MRSQVSRNKLSATDARNLRTLLLLEVFAPEELGHRIKTAREQAGLTQDDLADVIGLSMRQVQNLEAGVSKPFKHVKQIAEATGKSVEWLLHGEPAPQPDADRLREIIAEEIADVTQWEDLGTDTMRSAMKARGLSYERAARQVPVSERTWRRWVELGAVPVHRLPRVAAILKSDEITAQVDGAADRDDEDLRRLLREELAAAGQSFLADVREIVDGALGRLESDLARTRPAPRRSSARKR
jgi:transcriptional regulator with XRE-family HTH domain